jgi:hypothetical protein
MDHVSRASTSSPQATTPTSGSVSPRHENGRTRDAEGNADDEAEFAPDLAREDMMDDDPPQSEDATPPMNLFGALEKQARQSEDHDSPLHSTNCEPNETRRPSGVDVETAPTMFNNPPNLSRIRRVLFECRDPIEISLEEFETYWPFIDNVWVKQRSNASKEGHCTTDYYMCRLRRPTHRTSDTRPLPEGKRPRKKRVREGGICNFQIKVVRFEGAYSTVTIARTPGSSSVHSHDLDYIDRVKRNSGLMESARKESVKGYLPSSIFTKFQEEPAKLQEAGGRFLTVTDVRNVSAKWRIQNPEVKLVPHEGYEYQKGHGIVKSQNADGTHDATQQKTRSIWIIPSATTGYSIFPPILPRVSSTLSS